ncbi:transposable element Tcb1 transposase [Trichonephila clavipes]|nr:transposable element Tcb1 transposase [Trichonephila clavipes]
MERAIVVKRGRDTQFHLSNITERDLFDRPGVCVWGYLMLNGWTEFHGRSSVIRDRCCKEVILPYQRLFRRAIKPNFAFMDVSIKPHWTAGIQQLQGREDITRMDSPWISPDLSPIEHV